MSSTSDPGTSKTSSPGLASSLPQASGSVSPAKEFSIRSLAWSVYAPAFLLSLGQGVLIPVLPLFAKDELGASVAMVGVAVAARELGTMLFDVPAGLITSRLGSKNSMLIGVGLFAASALGAAISFNLGWLILMRVISGLGIAMWMISRHAFIAQSVPVKNRGRALATFGGLGRIATILGPLFGGLAAEFAGLAAAFYLQAAVGVATMALVMATLEKSTPVAPSRTSAHARLAQTVVEYRREFATAGLAAITLQLIRSSRQLLIPLWGDQIGLSVGEIGYVSSISSAIDAAMFLPAGIVMDRWGRRWTGAPSLALMAVGLALMPLTHSFWSLAAIGVIAGLGNGMSSGLVLTMGADMAPRERAGEFLGVWRLITDSGGAAGPLVIGAIAKAIALSAACMATAGIGVVGAVIMLTLVRETSETSAKHEAKRGTGPGPG